MGVAPISIRIFDFGCCNITHDEMPRRRGGHGLPDANGHSPPDIGGDYAQQCGAVVCGGAVRGMEDQAMNKSCQNKMHINLLNFQSTYN